MIDVVINGKECEIPENKSLKEIAVLYGGIAEGEPFFAKINGKTVNSIIDDNEVHINEDDVIEIFPLVLGG